MTNFEKIAASSETLGSLLEDFCWTMKNCEGCPLANGCGEDIGDWAEWLENEVKPNEQQNF